ncbi:MAG: prephenate dehydrogenase/arogenate dehydrogenase family protein, partial [Candidatus Eisenbacteria bacterium]|nr:prephenate dehydrogenase/arogenate dehydrogenase family protein [Candidatus Eisenbacteria bacterium]
GYISAHPMAGGEQGGFSAALPGVYRGASFVLTPAPTARSAHIAAAEDLVQAIGARSLRLDAAAHDATIAFTSQLPHALAAALTRLAGRQRKDLPIARLVAGSFRSATRVAARRPAVTLDMFLTNRGNLTAAIDEMLAELQRLQALIDAGDETALASYLADARRQQALLAPPKQDGP